MQGGPDHQQGPELTVEVNTFIPDASVDAPGIGTFAGDDRGVGEDGSSRTQQVIKLYADPSAAGGYRVEFDAGIGETHKLDENGKVIETGSASESDLEARVIEVRPDGTVVVGLTAQSSNPLVFAAPGITYDLTIEMQPTGDRNWRVQANGDHDAFPAYEVLASSDSAPQTIAYSYTPDVSGANPLYLGQGDGGLYGLIWGDSAVDVDSGVTVNAEPVTPDAMIERNSTNGQVDTGALGEDLANSAQAGQIDEDFAKDVLATLPPERQEAVAQAFFDGLRTTPGIGGGPAHDAYSALALTPEGMGIILAVGQYAPERLGADEVLYGFAAMTRDEIYSGDANVSDTALRYLEALEGNEEAQSKLAQYYDPIYDDDRAGMESTGRGRDLLVKVEEVLDVG